ncbi:MAG TPA: DNA topoisomerase IB [Gemmataceae bacterium]|nr:DNA topoisomerase IB [Gemmataceae bacterium]
MAGYNGPKEAAPSVDPVESAKAAGLRYVRDDRPGIRRVRKGVGFRYVGPDGFPIRDPETLQRIRSLAIPPAWTRVWICPIPHGHLQAVGRDARGRKQYRYHPRWRNVRDETKYHRLTAFAAALPAIRARVETDVGLPGLPRPKVLAAVVRLLETTLIRIGNEEYARTNGSFGLTTLRDRHVRVKGAVVRFHFRGKSGVRHAVDLNDRRLARLIRRCQDLPGDELFQYRDDAGATHAVDSADVNEYLRAIAGGDFTAKDFRTWCGTVLAAEALRAGKECAVLTERRRNAVAAVEATARRLGNTIAVCRKCYIHPAVLDAYLNGTLADALSRPAGRNGAAPTGLRPEEAAVLAYLQGLAQ